jgi:hypothetical protein
MSCIFTPAFIYQLRGKSQFTLSKDTGMNDKPRIINPSLLLEDLSFATPAKPEFLHGMQCLLCKSTLLTTAFSFPHLQ